MPFGAPPGPASGKPLGVAHCRPRCIENWALQAKIHRIYRFGNTIRQRKKAQRLCQGQATCLLVHRPAQHPARHWGRHTAAPDVLKTGHSKQKFTEFNVLATQYDTEKMDWRLRQGQATRLSAHRPAQRAAGRKNPPFQFFSAHPYLTFHSGGAPGPSTVFSAACPYGRAALLLPCGGAC